MFYIHGGAFSARSGNIDTFGPEFFMDHGVVMVIADYRYIHFASFIPERSPFYDMIRGYFDLKKIS